MSPIAQRFAVGILLALGAAVAVLLPGLPWILLLRAGIALLAVCGLLALLAGSTQVAARTWPDNAEAGDVAGIEIGFRARVPGFWRCVAKTGGRELQTSGFYGIGAARIQIVERDVSRGLHTYQIRFYYSDPLGIFQRELRLERELVLAVHPRAVALRGMDLRPYSVALAGPWHHEGTGMRRGTALFGDQGESSSVRPYRPGDRLARIHWPQTARLGELQVREIWGRSAAVRRIVLTTDAALYPDGRTFELAVSVTASLALTLLGRGHRVDLQAGVSHVGWTDATAPAVLDACTRVELGEREAGELAQIPPFATIIVCSARAVELQHARSPEATLVAVGSGTVRDALQIENFASLWRLGRMRRYAP